VKQHGGYVTLHSAARHGSTIRVYFPALEQAARSILSPEATRPAGTTTVLVVDDEEPLLRIAQRALEHCGYRVITATRGAEALALLRARGGEIDVVVSDLTMPGLSGRELHRAALRDGIEVPFIFTSGYAPGEASGTADAEQDSSFLRKPWTIDDLVRRVREALGGSA
jgi:CheY-like chemotaxis protein